jgi:hypothetical protein
VTESSTKHRYVPTEAKYKGRAREIYVTYDLRQATRGRNIALYPKVQRVYIAGDVRDWECGSFKNRTVRKVHGINVEYEQSR